MNFKVSRRGFLKWGGLLGSGVLLPRAVRGLVMTPREELPGGEAEEHAPALCRECPSMCMMQVRLMKGKAVGISGMPRHPICNGSLCPKGFTALQQLYHPDRLRGPRLRRKRDTNEWEAISWDQAFDLVRSKLAALEVAGRTHAFGVVAAPVEDLRHELQRRFASAFGTPNFWELPWMPGQVPLEAFDEAHGFSDGLSYDLTEAKLVVSFGWDWLQQSESIMNTQRLFGELRRSYLRRRARILQVESRFSMSAMKADEWFAIKPGTEGVVALAVAHVLISEKRYDRKFVSRWTSGFDNFAKRVLRDYSPERAQRECGIKVNHVRRIAMEMGTVKPRIAMTGRRDRETQSAVHSLNLLLGNVGDKGGIRFSPADRSRLSVPGAAGTPAGERIAEVEGLSHRILESKRSPLEVLWLEDVNPAFLSPNCGLWRAALSRVPFVVSFSSFMDETSKLADLVLPLHDSLESSQDGYAKAMDGSAVLSFAPPVVSPLYDTGDLGDFILRLASSLKAPELSAIGGKSYSALLGQVAAKSGVQDLVSKGGWRKFKVADAGVRGCIRRSSGKLKFPAADEPDTPMVVGKTYSLHLHISFPLAFSGGRGAHLPYLNNLIGPHLFEQWETWVEIHPATAHGLGIADRSMVWVESAKGRIKVRARHFEGLLPATVSVPFGLGHTAFGRWANEVGANPAELISDTESCEPFWRQGEPVKIYAV